MSGVRGKTEAVAVGEDLLRELLAEVLELKRAMGERQGREVRGLISYEDLQKMLTVGTGEAARVPSMRTVKELVRRHRSIVAPVRLGYRTVGFRPDGVERLLGALAGVRRPGGRTL